MILTSTIEYMRPFVNQKMPDISTRAIAFKLAFVPQLSEIDGNDAAHSAEHLAIGSCEPVAAILRVTKTQYVIHCCRTASWVWAFQCQILNVIALHKYC